MKTFRRSGKRLIVEDDSQRSTVRRNRRLLGTMIDTEVAVTLGVGARAVEDVRHELKIPSFRSSHRKR